MLGAVGPTERVGWSQELCCFPSSNKSCRGQMGPWMDSHTETEKNQAPDRLEHSPKLAEGDDEVAILACPGFGLWSKNLTISEGGDFEMNTLDLQSRTLIPMSEDARVRVGYVKRCEQLRSFRLLQRSIEFASLSPET